MIDHRVIIHPVGKGQYDYRIEGRKGLGGRSTQPLLDACRLLQAMGEADTSVAALFNEGSDVWLMKVPIGKGAILDAGTGSFRKYRRPGHPDPAKREQDTAG